MLDWVLRLRQINHGTVLSLRVDHIHLNFNLPLVNSPSEGVKPGARDGVGVQAVGFADAVEDLVAVFFRDSVVIESTYEKNGELLLGLALALLGGFFGVAVFTVFLAFIFLDSFLIRLTLLATVFPFFGRVGGGGGSRRGVCPWGVRS